jgi:hypothetical protein
MRLVVFAAAGLFVFIILTVWMMTRLQFRIGSQHLKILFFGLPVRKIPLTDIKRISKRRPSRPAEYWYNTLQPGHRVLSIQRNSGVRKFVVITPRNRYIFLADLQKAIQRLSPETRIEVLLDESNDQNVGNDVRSF